MSATTQFNPQAALNEKLLIYGASKTVYALVTRQTRMAKSAALGYNDEATRREYFAEFEEAWTGKQDRYHNEFFDAWHEWSKPVIDLDRQNYRFFYPTAGASQAIQHLIFDHAVRHPHGRILFFEGEYEGYKAMAEAAGIRYTEVPRDEWRSLDYCLLGEGDLYFVSQPSAIDGNVWHEFNEFVAALPENSVVADITYVGAIPRKALKERFNLNAPSIRNVVFSLSKPFGAYYDRIGGVWCREEDLGLFGYKWFKNLTSLRLGVELMRENGVFDIPEFYAADQNLMIWRLRENFNVKFEASDVYILATADPALAAPQDAALFEYITRAGRARVCLTPGMAKQIEVYNARTKDGSCL